MDETMREYLERRQRWYLGAFIIGLGLILAPVILASILGRQELREHREVYLLARFTGLGVLIGASLLRRAHVKCPKCGKALSTGSRWSKVPAFCPNCGVNFDEPMPQSPISP
jgi:hypothetical protein